MSLGNDETVHEAVTVSVHTGSYIAVLFVLAVLAKQLAIFVYLDLVYFALSAYGILRFYRRQATSTKPAAVNLLNTRLLAIFSAVLVGPYKHATRV